MVGDHRPGTGVCVFYLKAGLNPFQRVQVSEVALDHILAIHGVEELTYHRIRQSILILYDRNVLAVNQLCEYLKRIFPHAQYLQKAIPLQEIRSRRVLSRAMEAFLEKIDPGFRERIARCRDLALIMPVGAAIQPAKLYFRRVFAPTWLDFIWQLIVL